MVAQLVNNSLTFMEAWVSSSCSQQPVNDSTPKPYESSPQTICKFTLYRVPSHQCFTVQVISHRVFESEFYVHFTCLQSVVIFLHLFTFYHIHQLYVLAFFPYLKKEAFEITLLSVCSILTFVRRFMRLHCCFVSVSPSPNFFVFSAVRLL
jgi:hypothetical protein